jgi:hypothetical protein
MKILEIKLRNPRPYLLSRLARVINFILGDNWHVDEYRGMYGVCHPYRYHEWKYPFMTRAAAQQECDRLNEHRATWL